MKKIIFIVFTCIVATAIFLYSSQKAQSITFFYTGESLGELEPCGCSGAKTGGMIQRSSWILQLQKAHHSLLLVDGGFAAVKENRQQEIKFAIYHEILGVLNYDFRCFPLAEQSERWKAADKNVTYSLKKIDDVNILFFFAETNFDALQKVITEAKPNITIVMTKNIDLQELVKLPEGDFWTFVLMNDVQEPMAPRTIKEKTIAMSAGNKGRYAGLFEISDTNNISKWKHEHISLTEEHQKPQEIIELMEKYKNQVKEEQLMDFEIKRSSPVGFVGSEMCGQCHVDTYTQWQKQGHGKAFTTLEKQNYHHDPECISCHVVGYEFAEGYRNFAESDYLIHVGCESCHGAGANHAFNPAKIQSEPYGQTKGEENCTACHKKDHSPHFDYAKYKPRIKHWD